MKLRPKVVRILSRLILDVVFLRREACEVSQTFVDLSWNQSLVATMKLSIRFFDKGHPKFLAVIFDALKPGKLQDRILIFAFLHRGLSENQFIRIQINGQTVIRNHINPLIFLEKSENIDSELIEETEQRWHDSLT